MTELATIRKEEVVLEKKLRTILKNCDKESSLEVLSKLSGYEGIPPTITEFLEDDYYIGRSFDQGRIIHPKWVKALKEVYPTPFSAPYKEVVFKGAIGLGKSTIAIIMILYDLCKLLHLKSPQEYYRLAKSTVIMYYLYAPTQGTANVVLWGQMMDVIEESLFFKKEQTLAAASPTLFKNNIDITLGSTLQNSIGRAIIGCIMDESNFAHAGRAKDNYNSIIKRIGSRFGQDATDQAHGRMLLSSSETDDISFIELHLKELTDPEKTIVYQYSLWDVKGYQGKFSDHNFHVFIGSDSRDPFIIEPHDLEKIRQDPELNHLIIAVPSNFYGEFKADLYMSLRDLAGRSSSSNSSFITSRGKITTSLQLDNVINKVPITLGLKTNALNHKLIDFVNKRFLLQFSSNLLDSSFTTNFTEVDYFKRMQLKRQQAEVGISSSNSIKIARHIHIDLGLVTDWTGIADSYIEGYTEITRYDAQTNESYLIREPKFVTEFLMYVKSPSGDEVPISSIKELMVDLRNSGIPIAEITLDGYQSANIKQDLIRLGFNCRILSVDRNKDPYLLLKNALSEDRLKLPKVDRIQQELSGLVDVGKKIDHSPAGVNAKDGCDAIAGSLYSLYQAMDDSANLVDVDDNMSVLEDLLDSTLGHTGHNLVINALQNFNQK